MLNLFSLLAEETQKPQGSGIGTWIILGVFVVAFIIMTVVNNKKRQKQAEEESTRKASLCPGTKIITIGGIVGEVVSVSEDNYVLATGGTTIELDKRSIYTMTLPEEVEAQLKEEAEEVKEEQEEKVEE